VLAELKPSKHAVDFLHPRRRAPPPNPRKKWIIAAASAAALLLAYLIYARIEHALLVNSVADLEKEFTEAEQSKKSAKETLASTADIAKWDDENAFWLDRIYDLEQGCPPAEDAVLERLTATSNKDGGQITLNGRASGPDGIVRLEKGAGLHGGKMSANSSEDTTVPPYTLHFDATVLPKKGTK
jgi:hypothetical protein